MGEAPRVTVAVPSYGHGRWIAKALDSILEQGIAVEVMVADGGSTDGTVEVLERYAPRLAHWRSHRDGGQAAAVNEAVARGSAPFVCWLNSDDWWLEGGLARLLAALEANPAAPFAYGRVWNHVEETGRESPVWVRPFDERWMANACLISQPGTLVRRECWEAVGGLDASLQLAMDYDLWWKLFRRFGAPAFVDDFVAVNRDHDATKTATRRREHYREAMAVVKRHTGRVPLKWWLAQPWAVWWRGLRGR